MYKISVIVPVFNVEDTITDAFCSIKNQTFGFDNIEVIFVDDCSTDRSSEIIMEFAKQYDNVKSIILKENSGFAGKPRNVGIENSTADYLMFLDPDDLFLNEAFEILYGYITKNNLDLVSGNYIINRDSTISKNNWNILNLNDDESLCVESIGENINLLKTTPSVWAKIFRKKFILDNNINFPVGVPAQDLVFVSHALIKAKGIMYINKCVIEYIPRVSGDSKSITSKRTKSVLSGFIKAYTELYWILFGYDENHAWLAPRNLFFWIKQLSLSNLILSEKIELLHASNFLFEKFLESPNINPPRFLGKFLECIEKKDFLNAALISNKLGIYYESNENIINSIKNKTVFFLFYGMDINIGGLAKAVFNRANVINNHGYNIVLLNIDELKNFNYIIPYFKNINFLNESIDFINIFQYYENKYTVNVLGDNSDYLNQFKSRFSILNQYLLEKVENNDHSISLNYYDNTILGISEDQCIDENFIYSKISTNNLIKSEVYFDNYLSIIKKYNEKCRVSQENFFTKDHFNYLSINYISYKKKYTLYNRDLDLEIKFDNNDEFYDYFLNEVVLNCNEKPFLINECSGMIPTYDGINPISAYKIASIHTNPYEGNHAYGSPLRDMGALHDYEKLDAIVVLTEALKNDLKKELNVQNITAVPNFLNFTKYPFYSCENKIQNKISIFARLASEKNISDAIRAFRIVVDEKDDAVLEIYGRALKPFEIREEGNLRSLVKELKLENNVFFKGHVDNVYEEMSKSLATVFVSHFEGLGMVVLESLLNATPVVSYNINYGPSDFIKHGENGFLVKQYDFESLAKYILEILNNPENAINMGKVAQKRILNDLNDEMLFLRWEEIFKNVYSNSERNYAISSSNDQTDIYNENDSAINDLKVDFKKLNIKYNNLGMLNSSLKKENRKLLIRNRYLEDCVKNNGNDSLKNQNRGINEKIFKKIKDLNF